MLGPPKPRHLDEPIAVALEDLIPQDHFYRHLEAKLDLSFVREWTQDLSADRGRPSIDPVVFFTLQLILFFEAIRSELKGKPVLHTFRVAPVRLRTRPRGQQPMRAGAQWRAAA